jgi:hypothetical protein
MEYFHPLFAASYQLPITHHRKPLQQTEGGLNGLFATPSAVAHGVPVVVRTACPAIEIGEKVGFRSMFWSYGIKPAPQALLMSSYLPPRFSWDAEISVLEEL